VLAAAKTFQLVALTSHLILVYQLHAGLPIDIAPLQDQANELRVAATACHEPVDCCCQGSYTSLIGSQRWLVGLQAADIGSKTNLTAAFE